MSNEGRGVNVSSPRSSNPVESAASVGNATSGAVTANLAGSTDRAESPLSGGPAAGDQSLPYEQRLCFEAHRAHGHSKLHLLLVFLQEWHAFCRAGCLLADLLRQYCS